MALMKQILFQLQMYLKNSVALKLSKQKKWGEFWIAVEVLHHRFILLIALTNLILCKLNVFRLIHY